MRIPGWLFILGVLFSVGMTALCAVLAFAGARQFAIDLGESGISNASFQEQIAALPSETPFPTLPPTQAAAIPTLAPNTTAEPTIAAEPTATIDPASEYVWDDPRQVRILLLGIDQRTGVTDNERYFRTDTMMVVNVDPVRDRIGILSIPRDLWVDIPDGGPPGRINTANSRGDSNGYPGGGPALAMETVRNALGLRVDHYLLVNFDVFTIVTDLLAPNGVEVCVSELIDDPTYPDAGYGTIHVRFEPGCQMLNSEQLLQYARTRATEGSDFDRARRQQEVLKAMQRQLVSLDGVANLIAQAPAVYDELTGSFRTTLSLPEILSLANEVRTISSDDIHTGVIDNLYVSFMTTAEGDQVLSPNYFAIRGLVTQIFNPPPDVEPVELRSRAQAENAVIAVFNNTDVAGLAGQTRDWLVSQGLSITTVGNTAAPENIPTVIREYGSGSSYTARYLAQLMGLPPERVQPGADGLVAQGVAVIVGTDIQPILSRPAGGE